MKASVSVVIPARNAEEFLLESIKSVSTQTHAVHECIVVDDASTDGSGRIAESAGATVVTSEGIGVAAARNLGAERASGEYLAFLDADDYWLPTKLERQIERIEQKRDFGLSYCGLIYADSSGSWLMRYEASDPSEAVRRSLLLRPPPIGLAQSGLIPRSVFEDLEGFDVNLSYCADLDLALRIATRLPLVAVKAPLVVYRQHDKQMSQDMVAFEHDIRAIVSKMQGELKSYRRFKRQMKARMEFLIAMEELRRHRIRKASGRFLRALCNSPLESADSAARRIKAAVR